MSFLNPHSTASPTPSNASSTGATKRKRPATAVPPTMTAPLGREEQVTKLRTMVHWSIERLKATDKWHTFQEIYDYISDKHPELKSRLRKVLIANPQVEYDLKGGGLFRFLPKHGVRSAEDLKRFLQQRTVSNGVKVSELTEGWPGCKEAIDQLEAKGEILVARVKGGPKTVWYNDPSLSQETSLDFLTAWHKIALPPNPDDLRQKLEMAGLKPTSAPPVAPTAGPKEKKKKAARKSGRQTNTHMASILKDYSHKRAK